MDIKTTTLKDAEQTGGTLPYICSDKLSWAENDPISTPRGEFCQRLSKELELRVNAYLMVKAPPITGGNRVVEAAIQICDDMSGMEMLGYKEITVLFNVNTCSHLTMPGHITPPNANKFGNLNIWISVGEGSITMNFFSTTGEPSGLIQTDAITIIPQNREEAMGHIIHILLTQSLIRTNYVPTLIKTIHFMLYRDKEMEESRAMWTLLRMPFADNGFNIGASNKATPEIVQMDDVDHLQLKPDHLCILVHWNSITDPRKIFVGNGKTVSLVVSGYIAEMHAHQSGSPFSPLYAGNVGDPYL